jgi:hypothetical protein
MNGQAAIEWIVILSIAMLILAIMLSMNEDNYQFFSNQIRAGKVKAALNDLKEAVDFVYSQGMDAKATVLITVPTACNISVNTLPGGKGQIDAVFYEKGKIQYYDVYTDANITGSVPSKEGSYCMVVEYSGPEVNITRSEGSC